MREGILFIVSGPSGSGKTTLVKEVIQKVANVKFSVSCTTRKKRPGEVEGVDYRFVSEDEFQDMAKNGRFAEWAVVHGKHYGTPAAELEQAKKSGIDLLLDIDVQGARSVRNKYSSGVYIFVTPSSLDALRERLVKRMSDDMSEIKKRLDDAKGEMEEAKFYDYIIINDSLDEAIRNLTAIILAERCRKDRVLGQLIIEGI
jgi:guanylate kinase